VRQNTNKCPPPGVLKPCVPTAPSPPARGQSCVHCSIAAMAVRCVTTGDCMHRTANKGFARPSGNALRETASSRQPQGGKGGGGQPTGVVGGGAALPQLSTAWWSHSCATADHGHTRLPAQAVCTCHRPAPAVEFKHSTAPCAQAGVQPDVLQICPSNNMAAELQHIR
jgi:hypothetical protein